MATTAAHQCRIYLHQNTTNSPTTTMPRQRQRTSNKQMDRTDLEKAFNHRVKTQCSHKEAAEKFGVKKTTLVDAFNRSKKESNGVTYVPVPGKVNMVFTPEQEGLIVKYTIQAAQMFYGLPRIEVRRMVYNYAHACKSKSIPEAWERNRMATTDWYYSFMERHPDLVLKAPEGMSIARIVAFNKVNVETFFKAYTLALEKYQFTPDRIFNLDESSLSTVMKPCKVVCARGKPVATQVTRERGETMTFVGIISAAGQAVPPVFIIPRARWNPTFMRNTSFGSKGILHPSGWMNGDCFVQTLQHLHERSGSSDENKILLIMDNAECHMNINVVEFAIRHGIVIVTLPPHTTDKLQPLDVSVFGPFKTFLRALLNDHALMHPNEHITVHQLPEFACDAWTKAANPVNILSGYRATGIWPVNRLIFPDEAFVGAQVTERPAPPEDFVVEVGPPSSDGANSSDGEDQPPASQVIDLPDLSPTLEDDPDDPTGTAWPDPGTAAPGPNTATPGPSTATPGPNTATPGPSTATPGPSTATPGPSTATPGPSTATPGPNTATPGPSTATPGPSTATPGPSTATPGPNTATPGPSTATPGPSTATPGSSTTTPGSSTRSTPPSITPEAVRPFPKAANQRPYGKGKKRLRACILTENEEAIVNLRVKAAKKQKLEEKKKAVAGKKSGVPRKKKPAPVPESSEEDDVRVLLDDSSEYSDDSEFTESSYPFLDKEPEAGDFVLVRLALEEGRGVGTSVCYVAHVLATLEGSRLNLSFLRMKSAILRNTFTFPNIPDESEVEAGHCLGRKSLKKKPKIKVGPSTSKCSMDVYPSVVTKKRKLSDHNSFHQLPESAKEVMDSGPFEFIDVMKHCSDYDVSEEEKMRVKVEQCNDNEKLEDEKMKVKMEDCTDEDVILKVEHNIDEDDKSCGPSSPDIKPDELKPDPNHNDSDNWPKDPEGGIVTVVTLQKEIEGRKELPSTSQILAKRRLYTSTPLAKGR
ncbi:hypothetical protein Pmani_004249 [Petrolisthes manimaculis]|uniref:DDE-1 domain-containing protein n=1 Tax=Petrolisthes manimaculis TaxID=1843537 RepID=A0AAE1QGS1_9EUCA|nr:hypothetical protein Pmani_004249 [Petrolisthes manimaculis]